jgi:hypothetical protein
MTIAGMSYEAFVVFGLLGIAATCLSAYGLRAVLAKERKRRRHIKRPDPPT